MSFAAQCRRRHAQADRAKAAKFASEALASTIATRAGYWRWMMSRRRSRRTPNSCQKMEAQTAVKTANVYDDRGKLVDEPQLRKRMLARESAGIANRLRRHPICEAVSETCCFGVTVFRKGRVAAALQSHCCPIATDSAEGPFAIRIHWLPVLPVGGDGTDAGRGGQKPGSEGGTGLFRVWSSMRLEFCKACTKQTAQFDPGRYVSLDDRALSEAQTRRA